MNFENIPLPSYLKIGRDLLKEKARKARALLSPCRLCPRKCGVDRLGGEIGFCKSGPNPIVSSRNLHNGEEPPISGTRGSGAIFFANCNLRCIFCQNYPISQMGVGEQTDAKGLADMMLNLQDRGAHNINFVTPSHAVASILEALVFAVEDGLKIPLVYNSSGYDSLEELEILDGIIDVYMPDSKYTDDKIAKRLSGVDDYVAVNRAALKEMHRQVGILEIGEDEIARRGLLIRHLVLPDGLAGSEEVFRFIAEEISPDTYISLMSQYFPANKASSYPEVGRMITKEEYRRALRSMRKYNMESGFRQGLP